MAMTHDRLAPSAAHWTWSPLETLRSFRGSNGPARRHLDVAALSDHLQRDLGFLDGNDPTDRRP